MSIVFLLKVVEISVEVIFIVGLQIYWKVICNTGYFLELSFCLVYIRKYRFIADFFFRNSVVLIQIGVRDFHSSTYALNANFAFRS